jgi:hypothetical protein
MSRPAYRCDACLGQPARCTTCAARRAEAVRKARAAKRAEGTCTECARKAEPGFSRCKRHRKDNNRRSAAAHAAETRDA